MGAEYEAKLSLDEMWEASLLAVDELLPANECSPEVSEDEALGVSVGERKHLSITALDASESLSTFLPGPSVFDELHPGGESSGVSLEGSRSGSIAESDFRPSLVVQDHSLGFSANRRESNAFDDLGIDAF